MLDDKFNELTCDIGQELKDTARRIYKRAIIALIVFFIIELIAAIAISADSGEQVSAVLLALLVIAVEYFIARGFVHLITINLYAKGEMVHLLRKANLSKQNTEAVKKKKVDHKVTHTANTYPDSEEHRQQSKYSTLVVQQTEKKNDIQDAVKVDENANKFACPACGYKQPSDNFICCKCGTKFEKPLPEDLKYALRYQTDEGMIRYLKKIDDTRIAQILQLPKNQIRAEIVNLLGTL